MSDTKITPRKRMEKLQTPPEGSSFEGTMKNAVHHLLATNRKKKWRLEEKDAAGNQIEKAVEDLSQDELTSAIARTRNMKSKEGRYYWDFTLQLEFKLRKAAEDVLRTDPNFRAAEKMIEQSLNEAAEA